MLTTDMGTAERLLLKRFTGKCFIVFALLLITSTVGPLPAASDESAAGLARLTDSWEGLIMTVEREPPHRITGLRFAPARPPSDLPPAAPASDAEIVRQLEAAEGGQDPGH